MDPLEARRLEEEGEAIIKSWALAQLETKFGLDVEQVPEEQLEHGVMLVMRARHQLDDDLNLRMNPAEAPRFTKALVEQANWDILFEMDSSVLWGDEGEKARQWLKERSGE
ncbi:MAG: hypothetical protein ACRD1T_20500 [Acidimicrobiia bacterium]